MTFPSLLSPLIPAALPRPPDSVRISDIMSTSVRITWSYDVHPGDVSYYALQYKPRHIERDYSEISGLVTKFYTVTSKSLFCFALLFCSLLFCVTRDVILFCSLLLSGFPSFSLFCCSQCHTVLFSRLLFPCFLFFIS